jgi:hypothetical protein
MGCDSKCGSCSSECPSRTAPQTDFKEKLHESSSVKKVIGIVSGKGGVGKSLVTSMLAVKTRRKGFNTAVLDADITGPSIPKAFGLTPGVSGIGENLMLPATTSTGIQVMSSNLLLANETDPVIWRGPIIAGMVKSFWKETCWHNVDFMFVDMPPGTGDVPLTVFQSLPVDGIVIVTSPQELVSMIVAKAVNMAKKMNIPILGIVENMSYFECPDCGSRHNIFGESHIDEIASEYGLEVLAKIPINPENARTVDAGSVEYLEASWLDTAVEKVTSLI